MVSKACKQFQSQLYCHLNYTCSTYSLHKITVLSSCGVVTQASPYFNYLFIFSKVFSQSKTAVSPPDCWVTPRSFGIACQFLKTFFFFPLGLLMSGRLTSCGCLDSDAVNQPQGSYRTGQACSRGGLWNSWLCCNPFRGPQLWPLLVFASFKIEVLHLNAQRAQQPDREPSPSTSRY